MFNCGHLHSTQKNLATFSTWDAKSEWLKVPGRPVKPCLLKTKTKTSNLSKNKGQDYKPKSK
jgi:hypothetical protein